MSWIRIVKRVGAAALGIVSPELTSLLQSIFGNDIPATYEEAIKNILYGIAFLILVEIRAPKDEPKS